MTVFLKREGAISKLISLLTLTPLICLVLTACKKETFKVQKPVIGTMVTLTLVAADREEAAGAAEAAFACFDRVEKLMSPVRAGSDIFRLNSSGTSPVKVHPETLEVLYRSIEAGRETGGAFDITFASVAHLWNYKRKPFIPPPERLVAGLLHLVDFNNVIIEDGSVRFRVSGMKIGLGGVAKGYAIRTALESIRKHGVSAAIVDAGGDLQVAGSSAAGRPWRTGVRHPREDSIICALDLYDGDAIATSGDYERFVEYKGKRYQHIIDPRTGRPAMGPLSVTVLSKDPVRCDYMATAIMVSGVDRAKDCLAGKKDLAVVIVDRDMSLYISSSLKERVELLCALTPNWID